MSVGNPFSRHWYCPRSAVETVWKICLMKFYTETILYSRQTSCLLKRWFFRFISKIWICKTVLSSESQKIDGWKHSSLKLFSTADLNGCFWNVYRRPARNYGRLRAHESTEYTRFTRAIVTCILLLSLFSQTPIVPLR